MTSTGRSIDYPTNRLLAVIDDPTAAAAAMAELKASGIATKDLEVLRGEAGADRMDGTGSVSGLIGRLRRALEFTLMDQLVDFAWYEWALRDGRAVVMVRVRGDAPKAAAQSDPRAPRGALRQLLRALRDRGGGPLARSGARRVRHPEAVGRRRDTPRHL